MSPWCPLGQDGRRAVGFLGRAIATELSALAVTPRMARWSRVVRPVTPTRRETSQRDKHQRRWRERIVGGDLNDGRCLGARSATYLELSSVRRMTLDTIGDDDGVVSDSQPAPSRHEPLDLL